MSDIQSEESGKVFVSEDSAGSGRFSGQRKRFPGAGDELLFVHFMQPEKELGLVVKPGSDTIEHGRNMLAHPGPVRTTAREFDLIGRREKAFSLLTNALHHALGEASLQKLDERIDGAGAVLADGYSAPETGATFTATL